jgi:O-acetyl-ADP-ribose deacetylase (regulator of RNase III)
MQSLADGMMIIDQMDTKPFKQYVAMPMIGAGLGGGNWKVIEAIINHRLKDFDVRVYHLENF